jgi:hypothetical protein
MEYSIDTTMKAHDCRGPMNVREESMMNHEESGGLRNPREGSMMNHEESGYRKSRSVISVRKMDDISCVVSNGRKVKTLGTCQLVTIKFHEHFFVEKFVYL